MKHILLIDDNEPDRTLYRRYLGQHLGHERLTLHEAVSGAEALELCAKLRPDCVVLDNHLPDADGLEILAELTALASPDMPCVVMVTGGGNEQLAVQALNAGALDYLVKGKFDADLLRKTVRHAIEKNEWRQYEARYHAELAGINSQLQVANKQLARTNLDLDNFVYAASHDLKQPINNLRGLLDELRYALGPTLDPDTTLLMSLVDKSVDSLQKLITDLGTVVEEQRHPGTPRLPEAVPLADMVTEVLATLQPQIAEANATIETDFAQAPTVYYVPTSLRIILLNLVANAIKYRSPARAPHVLLRATPTASGPVLEVHDNGLGIDLARHGDELFQLFRRLHPQAATGTGVGLFLVNRLVRGQGGRMEVSSQLGEGTVFYVYLGSEASV